jgi:hypothetical protein
VPWSLDGSGHFRFWKHRHPAAGLQAFGPTAPPTRVGGAWQGSVLIVAFVPTGLSSPLRRLALASGK